MLMAVSITWLILAWPWEGVGCWGESWGAVMWVILEEGLCVCEEGRDVVQCGVHPAPSLGDPHC